MARRNIGFQTIRSEGGLLPPDLLRRILDPKEKLPGTLPGDYGLPPGERLNELITQSWNRLRKYWAEFRTTAANLPEGEPGTGLTNDKWNLPLLRELALGLLPTSAGPEIGGRTYAINRFFGPVPVHLLGCGLNLDRRAAGVRGAAAANPHGLVQELLNRSPGHLWGIVSNGLRFRILRDSQALSRQSFLEFEVEAMFAGEVYSDFVLLWLVAHATRFAPREGDRPETCWLEQWTKLADEQGTRALGDLRIGVEKALSILGEGFTSHPKNRALRETLRTGQTRLADFHGQLLRLVYRLIFLFVAEDRTIDGVSLLHPRDESDASQIARKRYAAHYSTGRLRELASRIKGSRHGDLWRQSQLLVGALSGETGFAAVREHLALPELGSFLWDPASTAALNEAELTNHDFLEALRHLAFTRQGKVLRPVDYKNIGAEELGGVYESLLALTPQISADGSRFTFAEFAGNERKTSGSYYTPDSLVQCLLDSALDPVVEEAIKGKKGANAEKAILSLKVCDPAVGSGHFLVGAAHRLTRHLARVRALAQGESEPSQLLYQQALRDVIGRCLYGVDVNPMAGELCRVSLWLEALEPGKPLSFLDHHIRVGNSLLGATPDLIAAGLPDDAFKAIEGDDKKACSELKKRNKSERRGWGPLFAKQDAETQARLQQAASALEELPDDRPEDIRAKELAFRRHEESAEYHQKKKLADAWCAAFVIRKYFPPHRNDPRFPSTEAFGITQRHLNGLVNGLPLTAELEVEVERLATQYQFFHWQLTFPEVFDKGGFDLAFGNPPWDTLSPDAKEFFSSYDTQVRFQDRDGQQQIIAELLQDPTIAQRWEANCRDLYALVHFLRHSGRYQMFAPGNLGKGDFNIYRMFVEAALSLTRRNGWASQIVPEGLYNGANCTAVRRALYEACRLDCIYGFENASEVWFTDIDTRMKFCLYSAHVGRQTESFRAGFNIRSLDQLAEVKAGRSLNIPVRLVKEFSPDALAIMELGSQMDIDIAAKMYRWPAFGDETAGPPHRVYMREIDMGSDRELFSEDPFGVPLYEGRMVNQFDHRAKGYRSGRGRAADWEDLPFGRPAKSIQPQWYVPRGKVPDKCIERMGSYRIGFCDVASPTNERTLVTSIIPPGCLCGHKVPTILFEESDCDWYMVAWVAIANTYAMDFIARKKVSLSLAYTILDSFPFPRLDREDPNAHGLVSRCLRLSCTGPEMIPLWNSLATEGWVPATSTATDIPGEMDDETRLQIRAEIDAVVARDLFALTRPELEYILMTFPTQQRYQEEKYGEFRSRRLILEAFE
jgi:hypothetical protein